MHEDSRTIKSIDWRAVFPFLHLFRAFRIALQPSKLFLGLALILVTYACGRTMDAVWSGVFHVEQYERAADYLPFLPMRPDTYSLERSGPFDVFMKYELSRLSDIPPALWSLRPDMLELALRGFAFDGPQWLVQRHPAYSLVFGAVLLASWAIFGGAIARVAAVQLARDAKISMRNALRFSSGKLLSFVCAPVILGIFIAALGVAIAAINVVFYLPWGLGPLAVGVGFIVTLAIGFVLTLAVVGTVGGFGLLYPTVAVEGTDSFDAISRSFSYLVARPGKLVGYSLVSLAFGSVTVWGIKLFVLLMIGLIRWFQMSVLNDAHADVFREFFPGGSFDSLSYAVNFDALPNSGARAGAWMVSFWYYLVVGLVGAYAVSFYFSASTIIYSLLRFEVDATELDDVYLEDADDEELLEASPPAEASPRAEASSANASPVEPALVVGGDEPVAPQGEGRGEDEKGEQPATFSSAPPLP